MEQPDLFGAREAKADGMAQVLANAGDWPELALVKLRTYSGMMGTVEDIKNRMSLEGFPMPHHPNGWGALTTAAIKRGYLLATGERWPARNKAAHCRAGGNAVYRVRG